MSGLGPSEFLVLAVIVVLVLRDMPRVVRAMFESAFLWQQNLIQWHYLIYQQRLVEQEARVQRADEWHRALRWINQSLLPAAVILAALLFLCRAMVVLYGTRTR